MLPEEEERLIRSVALQNSNTILLARQRAEQELIATKEALEHKTEELAQTVSLLRATLESTWEGILVTDYRGSVTDFNEKFVEMWRIAREFLQAAEHRQVLLAVSQNFAEPAAFLARVDEICETSAPESFDVLYLTDGRVFERFSKTQFVSDRSVGRVWSFRDITENRRSVEALRDQARILELLNATGIKLSSTLAFQELVQIIADAATQLAGAHIGALYYNAATEAGNSAMRYTLSGEPRAAFAGFGQAGARSLLDLTFNGEGPLRYDDILSSQAAGEALWRSDSGTETPGFRSYLAVPVVSRSSEVIGGVFWATPPRVFSPNARSGSLSAWQRRLPWRSTTRVCTTGSAMLPKNGHSCWKANVSPVANPSAPAR